MRNPFTAIVGFVFVWMLVNVLPIVYVTNVLDWPYVYGNGKGLYGPDGTRPVLFLACYITAVVATFVGGLVVSIHFADKWSEAEEPEEESPVVKFFREHPLSMCEDCGDREYVKCHGCSFPAR